MIPAITTDGSGRVDLYFRVRTNNVPISLTFLSANGDPYAMDEDFELRVKDHIGARKNKILLDFSNGLTLVENVLTFELDEDDSKVKPGEYYWELYKTDLGRPWLNGVAYAIEGITPTIEETTQVIVNEAGYNISVSINAGAMGGEINGGSAASVYLLSQRIIGGSATSF